MPCCGILIKCLREKLFSRPDPASATDLSQGVQQVNNEKHCPAPSTAVHSEDEEEYDNAALEVVHADFCPDDDDVGAPNPLALACSRTVAPGDPPWPTRQEFEHSRMQGSYATQ
jgi:hypothetical protein